MTTFRASHRKTHQLPAHNCCLSSRGGSFLLIPWLDNALKTYASRSFSAFQLATGNPMLATISRLALPLLFGIILAASLVSLYHAKDKFACGIALALSAVSFTLFVMGILGLVRIAPFVDPSAYFWAAITPENPHAPEHAEDKKKRPKGR